jgi:hypothetical protein
MKKYLIISALLGFAYLIIEVIFNAVLSFDIRLRGTTSLWMWPIGAIMGTILGAMNNLGWIKTRLNYFWMSVIGVVLIYGIEFGSGMILTALGVIVWRYTDVLNINGQITLFYIPVWFALCPLAFWLEDVLRFYYDQVYGEDDPPIAPMPLIWYYKQAFNPKAAAI